MISLSNKLAAIALVILTGCGYLYPTCTVQLRSEEIRPLPTIQRSPKNGGVYVVAHRGAHRNAPENTLAAYQAAIELGCDFVEIDIRTTKDGHFVSVHNDTVDAYTQDASGPVSEFSLAELKALDIGSRIGPEWRGERIPALDEILELCAGKIGVYLDLKDAKVEPLVELIKAYDMEQDVLWYGAWSNLERLQECCATCIPMPDPGPERNLPRLFDRFEPRVVAAVWRHFSASFVETCHDANALVIVDEGGAETWKPAVEWGADGIQTDNPAALIAYLRKLP